MRTRSLVVAVVAALSALAVGCGQSVSEPSPPELAMPAVKPQAVAQATTYAVFDASWEQPTADVLSERVATLSEAISAAVPKRDVPAAALVAKGPGGRDAAAISIPQAAGRPGVFVRYKQLQSDLTVSGPDDSVKLTKASPRIDEITARSTAEKAFALLATRGLVSTLDYSSSPKVSKAITRFGQDEVVGGEFVEEYYFHYPREINGIPVAEAGVFFTVSASGRIRSARLHGPIVTASRAANGRIVGKKELSLTITETQARARFEAEHPATRVKAQTFTYTFNAAGTEIEPRLVVVYSDANPLAEGGVAIGRAKAIGYPLHDGGEVVNLGPRVEGNSGVSDVK